MDYLIRRQDHDDWDDRVVARDVCHPVSFKWKPADKGDASFEVDGTEFQFIYEMFGIQVIVEGGALNQDAVERVLDEVVAQMQEAVGTPGYVVDMNIGGGAPIALF